MTKKQVMAEVNNEKLKALQLTLDKLEKAYGKGTVMKLGDNAVEEMDVISLIFLYSSLDLALGVKGFPKGRIVEIFLGPESSGKTTIALHALAVSPKRLVELLRLLMRSMHLTGFMLKN